MVSKFREVYKAITYVCTGLKEHCQEGARAEVSYFPRGIGEREWYAVVDMPRLATALEHFSDQFPSANVVINTENSQGARSIVQCRCNHDVWKRCPNHCRHHPERPAICVMVVSGDRRPSAGEANAALEVMLAEIHEYRKEYVKNRPAEHKHRETSGVPLPSAQPFMEIETRPASTPASSRPGSQ